MSNKNYMDCLSKMLMSENKDEFKKGADEFEKLENDMLDSFEDFNHGKILHQLLTECLTENIENMIMLLELFSKYQFQPFISDSLAQFLRNNAKNFQKQPILAEFIQKINGKVYLQSSGNHANLASAIVEVLSWMHVPKDPSEANKFYKDLKLIETFLRDLCRINCRQSTEGVNSFSACLQTLYNIISDVNKPDAPGPALVIVLQLFYKHLQNVDDLSQQVRGKTTDKAQFIKVISVLCVWLVKLKDNYRCLVSEVLVSLVKNIKLEEKTELAHYILPEIFSYWIETINFNDAKYQDEQGFFFTFLITVTSINVYHKMVTDLAMYIFDKNQSNEITEDQCEEEKVDKLTKFFGQLIIPIIGEKNPKHILNKCPYCQHYVRTLQEWNLERKREDNQVITRDDANQILKKSSTLGRFNYIHYTPSSSQLNSCKVGLYNLGNTCYMNSVLQALAMTPQLCHEVLLYKSTNNLHDQTILKKLQNLFALLKYSNRNALKPYEILNVSRPAYFMPGHQQDSSEFLCHLLDVLYEQEKSVVNQCNGNDQGISMKPNTEDKQVEEMEEASAMEISTLDDEDEPMPSIKRWETEENLSEGLSLQRKTQSLADFSQGDGLAQTQQLSDSHSDSTDSGIQSVGGEESTAQLFLVHKVFGGELKVTYQCTECNTQSHNTDKFRDLQLCFKEETPKVIEVQELLNCYLQPEFLKDDNKYRCDKCMKLCEAKRWTKILQAPAHLILTLKHFQFNPATRLRTKLSHKVEYNEMIKLPVSNSSFEMYHLYAAVVHSGVSMDYGHYFTYACDSKKKWYKFNDSYVSETTLQDFKSLHPPDTPYILFYKKNSTADTFEEDSPLISTLSKSLQEYIEIDIEESKKEYSKKSFPAAKYQPIIRKDSDDDDDTNNDNNSSSRGLFRADEFIGSQGFAH